VRRLLSAHSSGYALLHLNDGNRRLAALKPAREGEQDVAEMICWRIHEHDGDSPRSAACFTFCASVASFDQSSLANRLVPDSLCGSNRMTRANFALHIGIRVIIISMLQAGDSIAAESERAGKSGFAEKLAIA